MSSDEIREALEEAARDAAADEARPAEPPVEQNPPLTHSFETTVDPALDRLSDRFRAWRAARRRGPKSS